VKNKKVDEQVPDNGRNLPIPAGCLQRCLTFDAGRHQPFFIQYCVEIFSNAAGKVNRREQVPDNPRRD